MSPHYFSAFFFQKSALFFFSPPLNISFGLECLICLHLLSFLIRFFFSFLLFIFFVSYVFLSFLFPHCCLLCYDFICVILTPLLFLIFIYLGIALHVSHILLCIIFITVVFLTFSYFVLKFFHARVFIYLFIIF